MRKSPRNRKFLRPPISSCRDPPSKFSLGCIGNKWEAASRNLHRRQQRTCQRVQKLLLLLFSFAVMGVWLFLPVLRQTLDLASREADPICRDHLLQIAQDVSVTMRHVAVTGTVTGHARPTGHNAMSRATPTHPVETVANNATGRSRRHDRASHAMHSPSGYNCKETTTTADIAFATWCIEVCPGSYYLQATTREAGSH